MLADLKNLIKDLGNYTNENVPHSIAAALHKKNWNKFDVLFQNWKQHCIGQEMTLEEVNEIEAYLLAELNRQKASGIYPAHKKLNSSALIWSFSKRIGALKYELAKHTVAKSECYCQLKADHFINKPNREFLEQIGLVWYCHREDQHPLYQCKRCGHKWIISDPGYDGPSGGVVVSWDWDPKGYTLIKD